MDELVVSFPGGLAKRMGFAAYSRAKTTKRWFFSTRSSQKLDLVYFSGSNWELPRRVIGQIGCLGGTPRGSYCKEGIQQRRADDNIALVNGIRILDNGFGMANSVAN